MLGKVLTKIEVHGCVCAARACEEEGEEPGLLRRDNSLLPPLCYHPVPRRPFSGPPPDRIQDLLNSPETSPAAGALLPWCPRETRRLLLDFRATLRDCFGGL